MNVVGYVRVSSAKQVDEGLGLDVQREGIKKWCDETGNFLLGIHADEGISGSKETAARPGLGCALVSVEDSAEALVVYRLDRLARHLIIQETIIERLTKQGKRVLSVSEPDLDDGDPTRVLIRQVLGAISQYESAVITTRMAAGRRAKGMRGGFAFGSPPLGWRAVEGELVANVTEQAAIARIVQLRDEGASLRSIVATLTHEGIRPKRSDRWHVQTVRRVLQRVDAAREQAAAAKATAAEIESLRREGEQRKLRLVDDGDVA